MAVYEIHIVDEKVIAQEAAYAGRTTKIALRGKVCSKREAGLRDANSCSQSGDSCLTVYDIHISDEKVTAQEAAYAERTTNIAFRIAVFAFKKT